MIHLLLGTLLDAGRIHVLSDAMSDKHHVPYGWEPVLPRGILLVTTHDFRRTKQHTLAKFLTFRSR